MKNGDVLLLLGSVGKKINKTTGKISKSFRPFTVSITKSECKIAFDNVFDGMILAIEKLTDLTYIPPGGMIQDYCRASKNSYEQTMIPAMLEFNKTYDDSRDHDNDRIPIVGSCVTHVMRGVDNHTHLVGKKYMKEVVRPMMLEICRAKSTFIFKYLCESACKIWTKDGKVEFVDWIVPVYFHERGNTFYQSGVGEGIEPDNNIVESINNGIKRIDEEKSAVSLETFCNKGGGLDSIVG
jgi:hypothetical protein